MPDQEISTKHIAAVIDIGTIAIRMVIAEVGNKNEIRYLEQLQKPVRFGKDVFKTGRLSNAAMRQGVNILRDFKSVIDGYGISESTRSPRARSGRPRIRIILSIRFMSVPALRSKFWKGRRRIVLSSWPSKTRWTKK